VYSSQGIPWTTGPVVAKKWLGIHTPPAVIVPPSIEPASMTDVVTPARAAWMAATWPAVPPPATRTSTVSAIVFMAELSPIRVGVPGRRRSVAEGQAPKSFCTSPSPAARASMSALDV
jgi:hypothetical protein